MTETRLKNIGRIGLLSAAMFWGVSFVLMKNILTNITPFYIFSIRLIGAALALLPFCARRLGKLDRGYFIGGALMGVALLLGYMFQTFGLRLTTPGKNAFLTSVYCVIVPFLYWAYVKRRPDKFNAVAAVTCIAGIGFISLDGDLRMGAGDALTLVCGFFFALHIVVTARFVEGRDPVTLAMLQFAAGGVLALAGAVAFEAPPASLAAADVWSFLFLTVVSTGGCMLLQVFGQKYTPPSQASVILALESVFGALSSVVLLNELLTPRLLIGFVLTFSAVVISETKLEFLKRA